MATRNDIKAMPTFLLLKDGAPLEKIVGANPEEIKKILISSINTSKNGK